MEERTPQETGWVPTHSPMLRRAWPALQHPFSQHDFHLQQSPGQLAIRIQCYAAPFLPVCNIQPKEAGWRVAELFLGGDLQRDQVNVELHFSPESSNPWLNRELFPKRDGTELFCRSGWRCLPLGLGNVGDVTHIPGREEWPFLFSPSLVGLFCKTQLLIPHNRKSRPKEHIVFIST